MTTRKGQPSRTEIQNDIFKRFAEPLSLLNQMMVEVHNSLSILEEEVEYELFLDMFESNGNLVIEAVLPGIDPRDVNVMVSSDTVELTGEVLESEDYNEDDAYISETPYGRFARTIVLPMSIDPEKTEAYYRDGILRLEMPVDEMADHYPIRINVRRY